MSLVGQPLSTEGPQNSTSSHSSPLSTLQPPKTIRRRENLRAATLVTRHHGRVEHPHPRRRLVRDLPHPPPSIAQHPLRRDDHHRPPRRWRPNHPFQVRSIR